MLGQGEVSCSNSVHVWLTDLLGQAEVAEDEFALCESSSRPLPALSKVNDFIVNAEL